MEIPPLRRALPRRLAAGHEQAALRNCQNEAANVAQFLQPRKNSPAEEIQNPAESKQKVGEASKDKIKEAQEALEELKQKVIQE